MRTAFQKQGRFDKLVPTLVQFNVQMDALVEAEGQDVRIQGFGNHISPRKRAAHLVLGCERFRGTGRFEIQTFEAIRPFRANVEVVDEYKLRRIWFHQSAHVEGVGAHEKAQQTAAFTLLRAGSALQPGGHAFDHGPFLLQGESFQQPVFDVATSGLIQREYNMQIMIEGLRDEMHVVATKPLGWYIAPWAGHGCVPALHCRLHVHLSLSRSLP